MAPGWDSSPFRQSVSSWNETRCVIENRGRLEDSQKLGVSKPLPHKDNPIWSEASESLCDSRDRCFAIYTKYTKQTMQIKIMCPDPFSTSTVIESIPARSRLKEASLCR